MAEKPVGNAPGAAKRCLKKQWESPVRTETEIISGEVFDTVEKCVGFPTGCG